MEVSLAYRAILTKHAPATKLALFFYKKKNKLLLLKNR